MPKKAIRPSHAEEQPAAGGAAAVDRALSILSAFDTDSVELSLAEIAEKTLLYKSTILRLIASLEHARLLQKNNEGRYTLGPMVAHMYAVYSASFSLEKAIMPSMKKLVDETRESATFHIRQGDQRLCLCRIDSPQPIRDHVRAGDLLPLDRGVGGRVIMAFNGAKGTIYDKIRKNHVISLIGDRSEGVAGMSAPVFGPDKNFVGAITLTMPSIRFNEAHEVFVKQAAAEMTFAIRGHR